MIACTLKLGFQYSKWKCSTKRNQHFFPFPLNKTVLVEEVLSVERKTDFSINIHFGHTESTMERNPESVREIRIFSELYRGASENNE